MSSVTTSVSRKTSWKLAGWSEGFGRGVIDTRHRRKRWEVILEPDLHLEVLVVIMAYPVGAE